MNKKGLIQDCLNKLNKLNDMSWEDINRKYETDYSDDHLRKLAYGFKLYSETINENDVDSKTLAEIKKEKIKLTDLRTEVNRQLRGLSRMENVMNLISEEINNLNSRNPLLNRYVPKEDSSGKDGILILSDLHISMTVENSINKYNKDIAIKRLDKIINKTIGHCIDNNIDKLHLVLNGDLISGELHNSIKLSNQESLVKQIVSVSEIISQVIEKLSNYFYLTVTQNNGNHEAVEMMKDDRSNSNNYSMLLNEMIKMRTSNLSNVVFLDSINNGELSVMNVKGNTVVSCHGDQVNLNKVSEELSMVIGGENIDLILLGHYHQPKMFSQYNTDIYVNGSLISTDDYAMKKKLYNKPSQTLLILDEDGVVASYVMKVE